MWKMVIKCSLSFIMTNMVIAVLSLVLLEVIEGEKILLMAYSRKKSFSNINGHSNTS